MEVSVQIDDAISDFVNQLRDKSKEFIHASKTGTPLSREAVKYEKILKKMVRNCDRDVCIGIAKILTVLIGETVKIPVGGKGYSKYMIVVPRSDNGGHDYKIGDPLMIWHGDMAMDFNCRRGNHLPPMSERDCTLGTEEEVDRFYDTITIAIALKARTAGTKAALNEYKSDIDFNATDLVS